MFPLLDDDWGNPAFADESEALLYRSNLLGRNKVITNFGGGNTSAKIPCTDPLTGEETRVLWVKGSGGDLGSMTLSGFATLYLEKLLGLKQIYKGASEEDEMVRLMPHCIFNQNPRAPSIDTNLHAFLPFAHIDHMHPDAIIAIATTKSGEDICHGIFEGKIGWLPWQRPGFELAMQLQVLVEQNPNLEGVILQHHGLFTWGDSSQDCYQNTIKTINKAIIAVGEAAILKPPFSPAPDIPKKMEDRDAIQGRITLLLRSALSGTSSKVVYFNGSPTIMDFVNANECTRLCALGTSCPDHFLRTKIRPLLITVDEILNQDRLEKRLDDYRSDYARYYEACKHSDSPEMRDANPVIILIPGIGMLGFAPNRTTARIATEFFENAINVMAGAEAFDEYSSLPEQEAFDIEYWLLEEAKLQRLPTPRPLAGKVALVTGAAGGIGGATTRRLLDEGACVVCCDNNSERLEKLMEDLAMSYSPDNIAALEMDVTNEAQVIQAVTTATRVFGAIDILVANAGIASASAFEETSLDIWNLNHSVLSLGYFLVSREVFKVMQTVGGGSIIFIGSKNALASSSGAAAYSSAKAASLHLARCLALEGAPHHIRVNSVNPDAVLQQSAIWSGEWRQQRAEGYGIEVDDLEAFYRDRSLLNVNVTPVDIAKAVMFFATEASSRSTGNIINVDGGNATAFTR